MEICSENSQNCIKILQKSENFHKIYFPNGLKIFRNIIKSSQINKKKKLEISAYLHKYFYELCPKFSQKIF